MFSLKLNDDGKSIVRRGGHDSFSDDSMLIAELIDRMPGMSFKEYEAAFVLVRETYGEDALKALRTGAVQIVQERAGHRTPQQQGGA